MSELERQVGPLERQSEKAKIYLKKKNELRDYDINMFLLESSRIAEQSKEVEEKFRIADAQLTESNAAHEKIKEEYEKLGNDMAELDERINVLRETINNSSMTKSKLESQIQILTEQIHAAEMTDEHMQGRLDAIEKDKQERWMRTKNIIAKKKNWMHSWQNFWNDRRSNSRNRKPSNRKSSSATRPLNVDRRNCTSY